MSLCESVCVRALTEIDSSWHSLPCMLTAVWIWNVWRCQIPANGPEDETFELLCAAEVFNYIGNLEIIFQQLDQWVLKGTILAFSIELTDQNYILRKNGRFSHSKAYVLLAAKNWTLITAKEILLRKEDKQWVKGMIFVLKK